MISLVQLRKNGSRSDEIFYETLQTVLLEMVNVSAGK